MKTRYKIIPMVAIIVISIIFVYENSTESFLDCDSRYEQIDGKCVKKTETFHGKSLDYWQSLDEDSLVSYYENFGKNDEHFFDTLGALLVKSYFEEKLQDLGIVPAHEIEPDWGGHRSSLPPHIGYGTIVNATDGKVYRLTVSIHGNMIRDNFKIVEEETWENENVGSERKILECYNIFHCDESNPNFESCISAKKDGMTIEQLCLDSEITIDNGCTTVVFPDGVEIVTCE